jgi:hypothetical protein
MLAGPLNGEELKSRQQPYFFSPEKVLEVFFKDLFEKTTAGYVLYGEKPVDLEVVPLREKTIPGTNERRASVIGLLALTYWQKMAPNPKNQNYIFLDFPDSDGHELTLINRKAFLDVVKTNALLFDYKFGYSTSPPTLLENLIQNGFSSVFKENIALQGIVLGYGVENSICYECGSSFLKQLVPKTSPPNQIPLPAKNPEEILQKIKNKNWANKLQDLTCYRSTEINDRVKIPFSFLRNSKKSKQLLQSYKKYQANTDSVLTKTKFLSEVLQKFGTKLNPSFVQTVESNQLADFFTADEKINLSRLIAQTIKNTFSNEISPSFIQGMNAAETQNTIELSDVKFLDILWKRDPLTLQPTIDFFSKIANEENIQCLIPHRLYARVLKKSNSDRVLTIHHNAIKVKYLLKDLDDTALIGSYQLQEPSTLYLNNTIPGLSHGLLGMNEGEIREIYIHPDFVYGTSSDFGKGQAIIATVELVSLDKVEQKSVFPPLKPIDVLNYAPNIRSCSEFVNLQKKHAYACGFRSWQYYKKAAPLISLESILNEIAKSSKTPFSESQSDLMLKLEWVFLQK